MSRLSFPLGAACLVAAAASPILAQVDPAALQAALEGALAASPASGGAGAIVHEGVVLWHGQAGTLAPGGAEPVAPESLFALASVGKMYTATLALRLVETGDLVLDAPIAGWLPAGVPGADTVTVRQLLDHTSGYGDVYAVPEVTAALLDFDHPWTRAELLGAVAAPVTPPGSVQVYQNTNYILLAEVIERASGRSFAANFQDGIADPLGLTHSHVLPRPRGEFAQGVIGEGAGALPVFDSATEVPTALYGEVFGDGPVAANAAETALFLDALVRGVLLAPATLAEMLPLGSEPAGYGLGIAWGEIDGRIWVGHEGSFGGCSAVALHDPLTALTLVALANHQGVEEADAAVAIFNAIATAPEPSALAALPAVLLFVAAGRHRRRPR